MTTTRIENRGPRDAKEEIKALFKAYKTNSDEGREHITNYLLKNPDAIDALWWLLDHMDHGLAPYGMGLSWTYGITDGFDKLEPIKVYAAPPPRGKEWVEAYSFSEGSKILSDIELQWDKLFPKVPTHFFPVF